jgi:hypothetical protein
MTPDGTLLAASVLGAMSVVAVAAIVALRGGPRRRPAATPGLLGGRVRLSSRSLERAIVIAALLLVVLVQEAASSIEVLYASVFAGVCVAFSIRRGAFLALPAKEPGPDDQADDGYVDGTAGPRHG